MFHMPATMSLTPAPMPTHISQCQSQSLHKKDNVPMTATMPSHQPKCPITAKCPLNNPTQYPQCFHAKHNTSWQLQFLHASHRALMLAIIPYASLYAPILAMVLLLRHKSNPCLPGAGKLLPLMSANAPGAHGEPRATQRILLIIQFILQPPTTGDTHTNICSV